VWLVTVIEIVADVLEVPPSEVTDDFTAGVTPAWTSLRHLQIVSALEEIFHVSFSVDEIVGMRTVADVRRTLRDKGVEG
jgi:acyl carrier protein